MCATVPPKNCLVLMKNFVQFIGGENLVLGESDRVSGLEGVNFVWMCGVVR